MAAVALTPRLQDLVTRLEQASDFPEKDGALEAVQADVAEGYVSTRSLKVLQRLLVHCGEEDTLRTYLVGSQVVLPGLVVKEDKVKDARSVVLHAWDHSPHSQRAPFPVPPS